MVSVKAVCAGLCTVLFCSGSSTEGEDRLSCSGGRSSTKPIKAGSVARPGKSHCSALDSDIKIYSFNKDPLPGNSHDSLKLKANWKPEIAGIAAGVTSANSHTFELQLYSSLGVCTQWHFFAFSLTSPQNTGNRGGLGKLSSPFSLI